MHYGPVMIDLSGTALTAEEKTLLTHPRIGGIILFAKNYQDSTQLKSLIAEIRAVAKRPLLIAVDHEGGRIWQFEEGFTKLPAAQEYGVLYHQDLLKALQLVRDAGIIMAGELLECDVDLSFAPVIDLDKGISEVIGDRAFHRNPIVVTELAQAFIEGMNTIGMKATGKHFPGHGSCALDSHIAQPIDPRSLEELLADDLIPFARLAPFLGAIMPAHIVYPKIDNVPVGFSQRWLQDILRKQLNFEGAIISDCLSMQGAAIGGDFVVRARLALDAGCDMVILCHQKPEMLIWILDKLERDGSKEASRRLALLAGNFQREDKSAVNFISS